MNKRQPERKIIQMELVLEKSSDRSRSMLFGLLVSCIFDDEKSKNCPLSQLRSTLSIEEKYNFVMGLNADEVASILGTNEKCYEKCKTA